MAKKGKRLSKAYEGIDRERLYGLDEAVGLVKERAGTKFDETLEFSMNLGGGPAPMPTRWCAASSRCPRVPASRCGSPYSRAATRRTRRATRGQT